MTKPVYLLSACAISPQNSFDPAAFLDPVLSVSDGKLYVADPDYRPFISPVAIRRMSRQMKMGISAGMRALQLAGIEKPDAIITGTGLGSMTDMEHFLKDMITLNEETLNPTYFIQSTYNSVNGWLALQSKSTGYNQTYVNRGFSLELSLLDAQMLLDEAKDSQTALVGCFDELTPDYFIVKSKCGYWKREIPGSLELLNHSDTPGTIAGEGTAFFVLSNDASNAICTLLGIRMLQLPLKGTITAEIAAFLSEHGLNPRDIDAVVFGMNGDATFQPLYDQALAAFSEETSVLVFKHLTGEYPTATGFGLWLAMQMSGAAVLPPETVLKKGSRELKHVLVLNHYILNTCSLILLTF